MKKAIYAFSGDPITYGHVDIIERASKLFDELYVGIGSNPRKNYTFSLEERTDMASRTLKQYPNVKVVSFEGLLVDYAKENGIPYVVRGVRDSSDFQDEKKLHFGGDTQDQKIETILLFGSKDKQEISSSTTKEILINQGNIRKFVPSYVKQCLEAKMNKQYIVAVTGEIGSGKSYVSEQFEKLGKKYDLSVHNIELDVVGHKILSELDKDYYKQIRRQIVDTFGENVELSNGYISRKALGEIVFNKPDKLDELNKIMYEPLMMQLRREISGKKGLILINAALIAEADMGFVSNNNTILVKVAKDEQKRRLMGRNLTSEQISRRLASQYSYDEKKALLKQSIERDDNGTLWELDNSPASSIEIDTLFKKVVEDIDFKH